VFVAKYSLIARTLQTTACAFCLFYEARGHASSTIRSPHPSPPTLGQKAADQTKWNVPAHQALANLTAFNFHERGRFISKALREFVMHYGPLSAVSLSSSVDATPSHEPPPTAVEGSITFYPLVAAPKVAPRLIIEDPTEVSLKQCALRQAWREKGIMVGLLHEAGEPFFPASVNAAFVMKPQGMETVVRNLWSFIRLCFLRDYYRGLTAICKRPRCPTPYFLQYGRRRMYCSHKCAMADSSRAYRERVRKETEAEVRKELKTK